MFVCFLFIKIKIFSYPEHELLVEKLAKEIGFKNISLSHSVIGMIKAVPRGFTSKYLILLQLFINFI